MAIFIRSAAVPWIVLTGPADGATVVGNVTLSASVWDDTFTPNTIAFEIDGRYAGGVQATSTYANLTFDTRALPDGPHTLTAYATDQMGYSRAAASTTFTTANFGDTTAPPVAITAPLPGAQVSGDFSVTVIEGVSPSR